MHLNHAHLILDRSLIEFTDHFNNLTYFLHLLTGHEICFVNITQCNLLNPGPAPGHAKC